MPVPSGKFRGGSLSASYVAGGLGFCPEWYVAPAPPWGGVSEVSLWLLKLHGYCDCLIVHEFHVLTGGLRLDIAFKGLFQVRLAGVKW